MKSKSNHVDLSKLFEGLQKEMLVKLETKKGVSHPTTKGDASELNWINVLKKYLPTRYHVDKGHILDSNGNLSEQIDVVIYDRHYSPFLFNEDGVLYFLAESVYAVFEVKPKLDKTMIEYAGKK